MTEPGEHWPTLEETEAEDRAAGRLDEARIAEHREQMRTETTRPDGRESCYFWDVRAGECRYEMLFLGCEPCASCPG